MRLIQLLAVILFTTPAFAQDGQVYFRRKGNQPFIGPNTELKPTNCKTADDGTIRCDVQIVNPSDPSTRYRTQQQ
jgi:hypothetical protein